MGNIILGDVIQAVNARSVRNYNELRDELDKHQVGEEISITVLRDGGQAEVRVRLSAIN